MVIPLGELDRLVDELMAESAIRFTGPDGADGVPAVSGVYAVKTDAGNWVHVGMSQNLCERMKQHWRGGGKGAGGDLIQKVQDGDCANDRPSAQDWMARHCELRWIPVPDSETRWALEHRLKSVLQPKKLKC